MPVSGNASGLTDIMRKVGNAASGELTRVVLKAIAAEALTQAQLGFRESRDPYDSPWAPLKHRKGMPLRDTGRLANSISARASDDGFVIGTNVRYAQYHQQGTRGHKSHSRTQAVNKKGRFTKLSAKTRAASFRTLAFKQGNGAIPRRPFLPDERGLGPIWTAAIQTSASEAFRKFWIP